MHRTRVPGSRRDQQERQRQCKASRPKCPDHLHGTSQVSTPESTNQVSPLGETGQVPAEALNSQGQTHFAPLHRRPENSLHTHVPVDAQGPTHTFYESDGRDDLNEPEVPESYSSAMLTANAALERQREAGYRERLLDRGHIEGVSAELAVHLLDIHFSRHHFFLVTYRPAFFRDMMCGGSYYSPLLLFAILAVSARYSERPEVGGGDHSIQSGKEFYIRAKELLVDSMDRSSIPTATALLLMGNALVSAGEVDRGWLYTGMSEVWRLR